MHLLDSSRVSWASVVNVVPITELPRDVDAHCIVALRNADSVADDTALIVSYRVGRANYTRAYAQTKAQAFRIGDPVVVSTTSCNIARAGNGID
jgi:hypothetical protein